MKELVISAVIVFTPVFYPATVNAGLFSVFSTFAGDSVSANVTQPTSTNLQNMSLLQATVNQDLNSKPYPDAPVIVSSNALIAEIGPLSTATDVDDEQTTQISTYIVRQGDTISKIAEIFNVSVNTVIWANDLGAKPTIQPGQTLVILPISGVQHKVKKGETIRAIANKYKADINEVLQYNSLTIASIIGEGDILIIPDAEPTSVPSKTTTSSKYVFKTNPLHDANGPEYDSYYMRPITYGHRSQGLHGYNGVDLADTPGTPIYASASGTVIASMTGGWNGGYGNYVIISHPNGTQTLYAHNRENLVIPGQEVEQGQIIAKMGATGKATGSHVHFEIRGAKNPF